jgi:hypothetical protein
MFDTGAKEWKTYDAWPPKILKTRFYLGNKYLVKDNQLHLKSLLILKPVPFCEISLGLPRKYMTDDRFACVTSDVFSSGTETMGTGF